MRSWSLELREPVFALFVAATLVSLVRAKDQPSIDVSAGSTVVSVTPADVLLAALLFAVGVLLVRGARISSGAWPVLLTALAFGGWVGLSSLGNGATAMVAAAKLVELGVLTLAAAIVLDRAARLRVLVAVLVALTVAAVAFGIVGFAQVPGRRQSSFLGEHDLATLSTIALAVWLITLVTGKSHLGRLPLVAGVTGAVGITLGASFASLIGLYLVAGAVLLVGRARGSLRRHALLLTMLVCGAITAATLVIRSDNLGFLYQLFGDPEAAESGAYVGSWSSRLIYAYVGGRVFLDNPVLGTGWYGELPPEEYAEYLPAAHERFSEQPPHYFPPAEGTFVPQQTYDQVLYELGVVGAVLFLLLAIAATRAALAVARRWPRGSPHEYGGYVPLAWLCTIGGALAGTALFGGIPLAVLFWLGLGVVAAGDRLLDAESVPER